jgi:hypothetical protein
MIKVEKILIFGVLISWFKLLTSEYHSPAVAKSGWLSSEASHFSLLPDK